MIHLKQDGRPVVCRMPTLDELTALLSNNPKNPVELKKLAKACISTPSYKELAVEKPACGPAIGLVIVGCSGLLADIEELDEDDIPPEMAGAWVAMNEKGLRGLKALRTEVEGIVRYFIQSLATERNVDAYMAHETNLVAAKKFVEPITCYPAPEVLSGLQQEAPGLYYQLAKYALRNAGLVDEVDLGEA